ncbi:hypothetical protein L3Q82_026587 [Scortum barcoo]|uniref:Uncharacterized protein n=1 Tax=Scortum barcoo TaxID=214431 RepID=A0ACB8WIH4_9TELE|nr:hypothetical protein L3Q82_026587 [Scortum barcoo]
MVLCVSSSWVGTTQVVKLTFQSFSCPFFISWFSSNWNILFFPIYYSGHVVITREKQTPIQKFRECSKLFGEDGMTLKLFVKRTAPFSILWTLTNYLYLLALKKLTATDVSALYCCHKAFVFLLSWIVLKDRFMGVRIVAAIMAITGIVMMAYADGFHGDSFVGVALAVGSASTSALYKVLFKMFLGSANLGEVAHFLSTMGFFNLIFISCVPLILYFTKVEHWGSLSSLPWGYLCGLAGLWLVFNILVHVGVVLTYPILISIGTLLSVPGNAAVDVLKHEVIFSVGAPGSHLHHLPGLFAPAAARGVGLSNSAFPGHHCRQEIGGTRRGAHRVQCQHSKPQSSKRRRLYSLGMTRLLETSFIQS